MKWKLKGYSGTKSWFFERIKQDWQTLSQNNQKKEKTQINKVRDKKADISTDTNEIQRIIREYFENLYSSKLDNLNG
jgi:hypothetical protein